MDKLVAGKHSQWQVGVQHFGCGTDSQTLVGIQALAAQDIFSLKEQLPNHGAGLSVYISFFEIYGGRCQDLLNHRHKLEVCEQKTTSIVDTIQTLAG
jgi:hypothetical protein